VTEAADTRRPGRPRSPEAHAAILRAALELAVEGGLGGLSMEAIAARAGVGKATIYRRWPNKEALLVDAVATMKGPLPEPEGKSVRDDLVMLVDAGRSRSARRHSKVSACLIPEFTRVEEMGQMYQAVIEPRRDVMRRVLQRGVQTGELRADLDIELTLLMISGPSMMQNMLRWNPRVPEEGFAEALVDAILRGAAA
jgi:AcrR family transcriptional regulator